MVFNNEYCRALNLDYINTASGKGIHQFWWLLDDTKMIGSIPREWNHLVGEYDENPDAKLVHYTLGGPYFNEYSTCEYSPEWFEEYFAMTHCEQIKETAK
jgi:hypothetical protein